MAQQISLPRGVGNRPLDSTELIELRKVTSFLQTARTPHQVEAASRRFTQITERLRLERIHALLERALDSILDHFQLCDVVTVGQASRALEGAVTNYIQRRIHGLLSRWVKHPDTFLDVLGSAQGVLSGSTVLGFILGCDWGKQDLDVYVPRGPLGHSDSSCHLRILYNYLTEVEGYEVESVQTVHDVVAQVAHDVLPPVRQPVMDVDDDEEGGFGFDYDNGKVHTVVKLSRPNSPSTTPATIDLVQGTDPTSPVTPITRFHTTFVMNFISASSITILYPRLTFTMQGVLNERIDVTRPKQIAWMEKYRARGFNIITNPRTMDAPCGPACRSLWRNVGDKGCMVVRFDDPMLDETPPIRWTLAKYGVPLDPGRCSNVHCHRGVKGGEWPVGST